MSGAGAAFIAGAVHSVTAGGATDSITGAGATYIAVAVYSITVDGATDSITGAGQMLQQLWEAHSRSQEMRLKGHSKRWSHVLGHWSKCCVSDRMQWSHARSLELVSRRWQPVLVACQMSGSMLSITRADVTQETPGAGATCSITGAVVSLVVPFLLSSLASWSCHHVKCSLGWPPSQRHQTPQQQ